MESTHNPNSNDAILNSCVLDKSVMFLVEKIAASALCKRSFSGLVTLGSELGVSLSVPKKKITVMLIGNHSAGKSSFINW